MLKAKSLLLGKALAVFLKNKSGQVKAFLISTGNVLAASETLQSLIKIKVAETFPSTAVTAVG